MIDITRNAVWTEDCCGKMDLDFPIIDCSTRYWPDNTCKCCFILCSGVYLYKEHMLNEPHDPIYILESDYIKGETKEDCQIKARQWYNENVVKALKLAISEIAKCIGNDCMLRKYPPCEKSIPCCICAEGNMGGCNAMQPCPAKKGGER